MDQSYHGAAVRLRDASHSSTDVDAPFRLHSLLVAALLTTASLPVWAGRPLATDDAATADTHHCQVESWLERGHNEHAYILAGACGVADGLEVGVDAARTSPRQGTDVDAGVALKWAPAGATFASPLGELRLGLRGSVGATRPTSGDWRTAGVGVLGLASLALGPSLALHLNLGPEYDDTSGQTSTLLNLAATLTPGNAVLLFAELQATDRRAADGPPVRTAGGRWWLVPDDIGLDLTASRESGSHRTRWSIGFGWYGIAL